MKKQIQLLRGAVFIIALLTINSTAFADFVIKGGATMKVESGTHLTSNTDVTIDGATVTNEGTITLKGNFTNSGLDPNLGTGEFILAGAAEQTIGGSTVSEFGTLTVNNGNDIVLGQHISINTALNLNDGVVKLFESNVTVGPEITAIAYDDVLDATTMFATNGSGQLRKVFSGTSDGISFLFPVGDIDGTVEYSPITLTHNTGTFITTDFLGVNVQNVKHPNNNSYDHFLNRYWELSVGGTIASLDFDAVATYLPGDVDGAIADEPSLQAGLFQTPDWFLHGPVDDVAHTLAVTGMDAGGDITGVEFQYLASMKVFLEGAYDVDTDEMRADMTAIIPLDASVALSQYSYGGPEVASAIPADAVDWVLVELRVAADANSASSGTKLQTVAGFLMNDGSLRAVDGISTVPFTTVIPMGTNPYFVIIHRNHLSAMSATSPGKTGDTYVYDFTTADTQAHGTDAMIELEPGVYGLFGGETNISNIISNADKQSIDDNIDLPVYHIADCNLSGIITNEDKQFVDDNMDSWGKVPK